MQKAEVLALRKEYDALIKVADGLISVIRAGAACNLLTMARMAREAREAARKIASMIEKLTRTVGRRVVDSLKEVVAWVAKKVPGTSSPSSSPNWVCN